MCRASEASLEHRQPDLEVWRCRACGHRRAAHAAPAVASDYYENTPQDDRFVASLGLTRRRQARDILARLDRAGVAPAGWLDFGCGRGGFLREARAGGVTELSGFDTSRLSTETLAAEGFAMATPSPQDPAWPDWSGLPTRPRLVSLLDVIEHFEGDGPRRALRRLRDELPALEAVVVKVPVAEGALFQAARTIRRFAPGPYRQLFQVGTAPPHFHYFCRRSLTDLLAGAGFSVVDLWTDRDVDDLFGRMPAIAHWPGGRLAARAVGLFPADAMIAIARAA